MKTDRYIIGGALLLAVLLAGCDTSNQPATPPATSPTTPSVMTSAPEPSLGTAYPAPNGYPVPDTPAATAYPAPTSTP